MGALLLNHRLVYDMSFTPHACAAIAVRLKENAVRRACIDILMVHRLLISHIPS